MVTPKHPTYVFNKIFTLNCNMLRGENYIKLSSLSTGCYCARSFVNRCVVVKIAEKQRNSRTFIDLRSTEPECIFFFMFVRLEVIPKLFFLSIFPPVIRGFRVATRNGRRFGFVLWNVYLFFFFYVHRGRSSLLNLLSTLSTFPALVYHSDSTPAWLGTSNVRFACFFAAFSWLS